MSFHCVFLTYNIIWRRNNWWASLSHCHLCCQRNSLLMGLALLPLSFVLLFLKMGPLPHAEFLMVTCYAEGNVNFSFLFFFFSHFHFFFFNYLFVYLFFMKIPTEIPLGYRLESSLDLKSVNPHQMRESLGSPPKWRLQLWIKMARTFVKFFLCLFLEKKSLYEFLSQHFLFHLRSWTIVQQKRLSYMIAALPFLKLVHGL